MKRRMTRRVFIEMATSDANMMAGTVEGNYQC